MSEQRPFDVVILRGFDDPQRQVLNPWVLLERLVREPFTPVGYWSDSLAEAAQGLVEQALFDGDLRVFDHYDCAVRTAGDTPGPWVPIIATVDHDPRVSAFELAPLGGPCPLVPGQPMGVGHRHECGGSAVHVTYMPRSVFSGRPEPGERPLVSVWVGAPAGDVRGRRWTTHQLRRVAYSMLDAADRAEASERAVAAFYGREGAVR